MPTYIDIEDIATLNSKPAPDWRPGQRTTAPETNPDPDEWIEDIVMGGGYEL